MHFFFIDSCVAGACSVLLKWALVVSDRCAGEAPVGAEQVRADRGGVQGEEDRHVPRLRRHAVSHRRRPGLRLHVRHGNHPRIEHFNHTAVHDRAHSISLSSPSDAAGGAQRRQALPDGDRQRPVPRQGTHIIPNAIPGDRWVQRYVLSSDSCRVRASSGVRVREAGGALLRR